MAGDYDIGLYGSTRLRTFSRESEILTSRINNISEKIKHHKQAIRSHVRNSEGKRQYVVIVHQGEESKIIGETSSLRRAKHLGNEFLLNQKIGIYRKYN